MAETGGVALIAKTLGEQQSEKANNFFSAHYFYCDYRYVMSALGLMIMRPIAIIMGATGDLLDKSVLHGDIMISCQTALMLQTVFQSLLPAAEKPKMGLILTLTTAALICCLTPCRWVIVGAGRFFGNRTAYRKHSSPCVLFQKKEYLRMIFQRLNKL